jgi:crotonobetainyl-CoA:carnitine CoA-transferase CaiB-like acyl-CoA transferase
MNESLSHLRVVEIGQNISAPYCSKLLADLGADVMKVEIGDDGDPLRQTGSFPNDSEDRSRGCLFQYLNANKRSVHLDLTAPEDMDILMGILAGANLLIENLGCGVMEASGLSPDRLAEINDRMAVIRISDFGQDGPYASVPATDFTVQAAGGWVSKHQSPITIPVQVGGNFSDYVTGIHAACAALTACRSAAQLEQPVVVDVSKHECMVATLPFLALYRETLQLLDMGEPEDRIGAVPGIVKCRDGYIGINTLTAQQWADCCNIIGVPEYIPRQLELRLAGEVLDRFYQEIEPWLMERTANEIIDLCQTLRIPAVLLGNGKSLPEVEQLKARGYYTRDQEDKFIQPNFPYRLEKTPASLRRKAPKLGEHNPDIEWASSDTAENNSSGHTKTESRMPFEGIRALDLGGFWAGPYVGCYLGACGADVIKVESIQRPDGFRFGMSYPNQGFYWYEMGGGYLGSNLSKRDITLDLNQDAGKRIFERLVTTADVLIENFTPRVMSNFGFGPDRLREINPNLIILRMPGFGLDGPWKDFVGWASAFEEAIGISWLTGHPDGTPLSLGGPADPSSSMHALVALQAALEHRERTGEAQVVEVAQVEALACMTAEQVIAYSVTGKVMNRIGNRSQTMAPQGVYKCRDERWLALSVRNDSDWERLTKVLGSPAWAMQPEMSTLSGRQQHHDEIDSRIGEWASRLTANEAVERIRAQNIPVGTTLQSADMYSDPQLVDHKFFQELPSKVAGPKRYPRFPMRQRPGTEGTHRFGPPTLGEHNTEILSTELGLSDKEMEDLAHNEVIGTVPKGIESIQWAGTSGSSEEGND